MSNQEVFVQHIVFDAAFDEYRGLVRRYNSLKLDATDVTVEFDQIVRALERCSKTTPGEITNWLGLAPSEIQTQWLRLHTDG